MNAPNTVPPIPGALMDHLEALYPDRLSRDPTATTEDLRYWQGQQNVMDYLRRHFEKQNKTILKGS